jgi:hypothetical protein
MKYEIIDNYLPEENFRLLKELLLSSNFPYYFQNWVSFAIGENPKYYFNHLLYRHNSVQSWYYTVVMNPILEKLQPKTLIRSKVNCYVREESNYVHEFHTDFREPHTVALLSINTNNGKTILNVDEELIEINSVENRMIIFDGSILHAPMSCTDAKLRVNININFLE